MSDSVKDLEDKNENSESLENLFEKLDGILDCLDERDVPLEKAFRLYEEGIKTVKLCNDKLDTVEKQMQVIMGEGEL